MDHHLHASYRNRSSGVFERLYPYVYAADADNRIVVRIAVFDNERELFAPYVVID